MSVYRCEEYVRILSKLLKNVGVMIMAAFVAVIYLLSAALCIVVAVAIHERKMKKFGNLYFICSVIPVLNTILAVGGIIYFDIEELV